MRTTGVSGRLLRVATVVTDVWSPCARAGSGAASGTGSTSGPAGGAAGPAAGRPGSSWRWWRWNAVVDDQHRRGFVAEAARPGTHTPGAGEDVPAADRLPHGAGGLRPGHHQAGRDRVGRQRPDVRRRDAHLHARRRRQRQVRADQPHQHVGRHQRRRHRTTSTPCSSTTSSCRAWSCRSTATASSPTKPTGRRREVDRHERRRRGRQARAVLHGRRLGRDGNLEHQQSRLRLGHGQLDLQHLQRVPLPLDAERHPARADRRRTAASGA